MAAFQALPRVRFGQAQQQQGDEGEPAPPTGRVNLKDLERHAHEARLAAEVLPELPTEGQAVHVLLSGRFDLSTVLCDIVRRHPVERLTIATLSANRKSLRGLVNEIDDKNIGELVLLTSGFFARHNRELFRAFLDELAVHHPASRLRFGKSHCKVCVLEFKDGSAPLVLEGSANLRSNDSCEQLAAIRNPELANFHSAWITRLADACNLAGLSKDAEGEATVE